VVHTQYSAQEIINNLRLAGVPRDKLILIENGIDFETFSSSTNANKTELRRELSLEEGSLIIGSLGRLTEQKDYQTFIKAAAEILKVRDGIEFIVAGEGHLRPELVSLCEKLAIEERFHFPGFRNDSASLLKLMDIFVLSSLDEGLPIAMLEAMATGLPIVTTGVGAIPDVIKNDKNGMIMEKGDFKCLEEILLSLISDPEKRKKLGGNAYETVREKYSNERMTERYLNVYNKSTARFQRSSRCSLGGIRSS
jgi:glycosyltransferase involved in cell wall biosynthesis